MKKVLTCVGVLWPLAVFAAAGGGGTGHSVFINGKLLTGNAVEISGTLAVPLEDLSKAVGSSVSLEPALQLNGGTLNAKMGWDVKKNVKASAASAVGGTGAQGSSGGGGTGKVNTQDIHITQSVNKASTTLFRVNHDGPITNHIFTLNGKSYVALSDVVKALGGVWTQPAGGLAPGATVQLTITANPNAILIGL